MTKRQLPNALPKDDEANLRNNARIEEELRGSSASSGGPRSQRERARNDDMSAQPTSIVKSLTREVNLVTVPNAFKGDM